MDRDFSVHLEAYVVPTANPVTVVEVGSARVSLIDVGLVVAAAGADGPGPTSVAVVPRADVVRIQELAPRGLVDAAFLEAAHLPDR